MIKGIEKFRFYFDKYKDQYVLIGGSACDLLLTEADLSFRRTKDLDIVLVADSLTSEFGAAFWQFIKDGRYENRYRSDGKPQYYRFDKPQTKDFPVMLELFSNSAAWEEKSTSFCVPIHLGEDLSSVSAILLNKDYYQLLLKGRTELDGVIVLDTLYLILFKARAYLDLRDRKARGDHIDRRDIQKHKNDIARLTMLLTGNENLVLSKLIQTDIKSFLEDFRENPPDVKNLKISASIDELAELLDNIFLSRE